MPYDSEQHKTVPFSALRDGSRFRLPGDRFEMTKMGSRHCGALGVDREEISPESMVIPLEEDRKPVSERQYKWPTTAALRPQRGKHRNKIAPKNKQLEEEFESGLFSHLRESGLGTIGDYPGDPEEVEAGAEMFDRLSGGEECYNCHAPLEPGDEGLCVACGEGGAKLTKNPLLAGLDEGALDSSGLCPECNADDIVWNDETSDRFWCNNCNQEFSEAEMAGGIPDHGHDIDYGGDFDDDRSMFADPGGHSALRAASDSNPRNLPCPNCGTPNALTPADRAHGYQCDRCADTAEGRYSESRDRHRGVNEFVSMLVEEHGAIDSSWLSGSILDARGGWPYPQAKDRNNWHEISAEHADEFLGVLPPLRYFGGGRGFFVGEPADHEADGTPVHAAVVAVGGRYFMREVPVNHIKEALGELHRALSNERTTRSDASESRDRHRGVNEFLGLLTEAYGEDNGAVSDQHDWQTARFTGNVTCRRCGLLPLDDDDASSPCVRVAGADQHYILDCQYLDGSVVVEPEPGESGEGEPVARFRSVRKALQEYPQAHPVCPSCQPFVQNGMVEHEGDCTRETDGACESAYDDGEGEASHLELQEGCDQCQAMTINGVATHEHGCPNSWVNPATGSGYEVECFECGTPFTPTGQPHKNAMCNDCSTDMARYNEEECPEDACARCGAPGVVDAGLCDRCCPTDLPYDPGDPLNHPGGVGEY